MKHKYSGTIRMSALIEDDITLLSTISRFGISFGFGNKTIEEVCELNDVDTYTFLELINFLAAENSFNDTPDISKISIETVILYLKNGHFYFTTYKLPSIRKKLFAAISENGIYKEVITRFFDEYESEVQKHMDYEDSEVFPYVINLLQGTNSSDYRIAEFKDHHTDVETKLSELKEILIKHYSSKGNNFLMNEVILDIFCLEKDLVGHNWIEEFFFIPVIELIEQNKLQDE